MPRGLVCLVLAATSAACSTPCGSVLARVGQSDIDGHVAVADSGQPLADNTLDEALGLGKDDSAPGLRADLDFGSPHVVLAWGRTKNGGDGTLTGELSDDDVTLPVGTEVATTVDLHLYTAIATWDVLPSPMFELGLGLGFHVADLEALVASRDPLAPGSILVDQTLPIPVLALQAAFAIDRFDIGALLSGIAVESGSDEAKFYDVDLMARYRFLEQGVSLAIAGGWRFTRLDAEYDDDGDDVDVDMKLSGPYVGLSLGF